MLGLMLYGMGFFVMTLVVRYGLHRFRTDKDTGKFVLWRGPNAILAICILGIWCRDINYFAAIIGFILADILTDST